MFPRAFLSACRFDDFRVVGGDFRGLHDGFFLFFGKWKNDDATMVGDGLGGVWNRFGLIWIGSDIKNHGIMKNPNVG